MMEILNNRVTLLLAPEGAAGGGGTAPAATAPAAAAEGAAPGGDAGNAAAATGTAPEGGGSETAPAAGSAAPEMAPAAETTDSGNESPLDAAADAAAEAAEAADDPDDPWKGTWVKQISRELQEKYKDHLETLKGKHFSDIIDECFTAQQTLKKAVVFPQKGASAEEVRRFLKTMNIPLEPDGYGLKPELLGEGEETKAFTQNLAQRMHRMGLTKKQGAQMFAEIASLAKAGAAQQQAVRKNLSETFDSRLEAYLGKDTAKAQETLNFFKRFFVSLNDRKLVKELDDAGMLFSPRFVAAMAAYHRENAAEPPLAAGGRGGSTPQSNEGLTKTDAFTEQYGQRS
jgi:hypothetical protein